MPSDDADTPKGALIALTLATCIVLFIVISTFESCTHLEGDRLRAHCSEVRFSIEPYLRESKACITIDGTLKFSIVNTGELDIEHFTLKTMGRNYNTTLPVYTPGSQQYDIEIGRDVYETMSNVEFIPAVYYPETESIVQCKDITQFIKRPEMCIYD
ncbi:MAG: hypothetical protein ACLFPQ_04725 [Candidatus Woesearchaeota archaeon]